MGQTVKLIQVRDIPRNTGLNSFLSEPTTWSDAESVLELDDPKLERVRVSLWKNLHFRKAAARPMLLLRVERLNAQGNLRMLKPLWLAWVGEEMSPVEEVWRQYYRRFTIDHWYRFLKQRLHAFCSKTQYPQAI